MKQNKVKQIPGPKVTAEVELRLQRLAQKAGVNSLYQLMAYVTNALIQYMDTDQQLDPELQEVIDIFERFEGWGQATTLTDVGQRWRACEAVYFVQDELKTGMMACWAKKPFFTEMKVTFNKKDILDMIIRRMYPELNRQLSLLALQFGTGSHYETIRQCANTLLEDPDEQTIRDMFADCARSEFGKDTALQKFIRHNSKNIEVVGLPRQTTIFDYLPEENNEQGQELPKDNEQP